MTVSTSLPTIADSISSFSIAGVNVFDIDHVPVNALDYCPCFFPVPNGFVTNIQFTPQSMGGDSARKLDLGYTLRYRYLHAPVGSGSILANYAGIIDKLSDILEAILSNSTPSGSVDMALLDVTDLGMITDLSGNNSFHGVDITLRVLEYAQ